MIIKDLLLLTKHDRPEVRKKVKALLKQKINLDVDDWQALRAYLEKQTGRTLVPDQNATLKAQKEVLKDITERLDEVRQCICDSLKHHGVL